jgi:hypothetical protein
MARRLVIRSLTVATASATRTFEFGAPFTLITGDVTMGKSSLLMLVKHAFGGRAALTPAVKRHVAYVKLVVDAGATTVVLRRKVLNDDGMVEFLEFGTDVVETRMRAIPLKAEDPSPSKVLLAYLEIPIERIPRNNRGGKPQTVALTFNDIFSYCFVQAKEIDRSVVGHLDSQRNAKRVASFNLMFELVDSRMLDLQRRRNVVREEKRKTMASAEAVEMFIRGSGSAELSDLQRQRMRVLAALRDADAALEEVRHEVTALTQQDRESRRLLTEAVSAAREIRLRAGEARDQILWRESSLAQLRLDVSKLERLNSAAKMLAPFEFLVCPRCAQGVTERAIDEDRCLLCLQPEPIVDIADSTGSDTEIARLTEQIAETESLLLVDHGLAERLATEADEAEIRVARLNEEYDRATDATVSPRIELVATRSTAIANLKEQLRSLDSAMEQWKRLEQLKGEAVAKKKEDNALRVEIREHEQRLSRNRVKVELMSHEFADEVAALGIPVHGEPRIDLSTFLPMIGNSSFEFLQASGGGASTALNVAYHLTLLRHSVGDPNVMLPSLLVLDSPRKAIGNSEADRELGRRIYSRLRLLADAVPDKVQLIVADNDFPEDIVGDVYRIELTAESSVVPGVLNTGVGEGSSRVEDFDSD